jgi:Flp pilus assembly protein CpaB
MALITAPDVVPVQSKDRGYSLTKPTRKGNPIMVLAVVIVFLLLAVGIWRSSHNGSAVEKTVTIVAAGLDIPAGSRIRFTSVHYMEIPKRYYSPSMALTPVDLVGRMAKTYIPMGEPIQETMLFSGSNGLSALLENDERAITLQLSDEELVGHFITQGDRVDVIVASAKDEKRYTKTICQNLDVLMCVPKDQTYARSGNSDKNSITLAVPLHSAEVINEALEVGKIRLVLRNHLGRIQPHLLGADPRDLLPTSALIDPKPLPVAQPTMVARPSFPQLPPPPPIMPLLDQIPPLPAPVQWAVEVLSGNHRETYVVPNH